MYYEQNRHPFECNYKRPDAVEISKEEYDALVKSVNDKWTADHEALMLSLKPQEDYEKQIQDKLREMAIKEPDAKNPPIDADLVLYQDTAAANNLVKSTWTQIKAFLKTYFDTLYHPITALFPGLTGDGSDGNVVLTGNTTLVRDMMYNNLTINVGVTLFPVGFTIRVKETLINNGTINEKGGNGQTGSNLGAPGGAPSYTGSTCGSNIASGALGGGGALAAAAGGLFGAGGVATASALSSLRGPVLSYAGGGGAGGGNHAAVAVAGSAGGAPFITNPSGFHVGGVGGAGLGAGSVRLGGGSGGAGGGVIDIWTNIINNNGTITADGGNGGPGLTSGVNNSGNGGGGGGGVVILHYKSTTGGGLGVLSAAGGAAGVGGNGGAAGSIGVTQTALF